MNFILRTIACVTIATGFTGAFWWTLTTTLDDMTRKDCLAGVANACRVLYDDINRADCQSGHVRACEALKQP